MIRPCRSEANRAYAICATILVAVAALCYLLDSRWINKVLNFLRLTFARILRVTTTELFQRSGAVLPLRYA